MYRDLTARPRGRAQRLQYALPPALAPDAVVVWKGRARRAFIVSDLREKFYTHLPGVQEELARAVVETGTPVVLVLVAGRPSGSAWLHEQCAAVRDGTDEKGQQHHRQVSTRCPEPKVRKAFARQARAQERCGEQPD